MTPKSQIVDRAAVLNVGKHILAVQLAGQRDPSGINDRHLASLADLSVRAALALDAAIPRAEERLAAEATAAEEAKAAADAAEAAATKAAKDAEKAAAKETKPNAKAST